jgi:hypothetical protein
MRVLRVAISPLLAAWLVLLAGIGPAHCLLPKAVAQDLCAPAAVFQQEDPSGHDQQAAEMACLVCSSLPATTPPDTPALAGPLCHAPHVPSAATKRHETAARIASLPPARAPPTTA